MNEKTIRTFGVAAIVGGVLNVIADLFILSQPIPADFKGAGIRVLEFMPVENVRIGVIIGFFALTSWLLILPSVSAGLARAKAIERRLAIASFTLGVTACVVFHCLYWPITVAIQGAIGCESFDLIVKELEETLNVFQSAIFLSFLVFTVDLAWTIFRKRADYPWWVPLISPLVTLPTLGNLVNLVPAPYFGYVAGSITTFLSTIFIAGLVLARRPSA